MEATLGGILAKAVLRRCLLHHFFSGAKLPEPLKQNVLLSHPKLEALLIPYVFPVRGLGLGFSDRISTCKLKVDDHLIGRGFWLTSGFRFDLSMSM